MSSTAPATPELKTPLGIRIPPELRKWLKHQAVENDRSLNSEIIARLRQSRTQQEASHG